MPKVRGKIVYLSEIKKLNKLYSVGLRLDCDAPGVWHNVVGFSEKIVKSILGDVKVGDEVEIEEEPRGNYLNVKSIRKIERLEPQPIEMKDVEVFAKCITDARKILPEELQYPQLVLMVACKLFDERFKSEKQ